MLSQEGPPHGEAKRFRTGLVVGKFAPLHRGHELLIRRAMACSEQVVIISYSKPELPGCPPEVRRSWLTRRFPAARVLVVSDTLLAEASPRMVQFREVPDNAAPAAVHRAFVGELCSGWLRVEIDAVFTSETYGEGFAEALTKHYRHHCAGYGEVAHVLVDLDRTRVPISATQVRSDVHAFSRYLSPEVYASFVERIVLFGGESSGKSTLSAELAAHFGTGFVAEYGRDLWEERAGQLSLSDMDLIAREQIHREEVALLSANRYLFCDTSPLTTLLYSRVMFGRASPFLEHAAKREYEVTVLCRPDFPFVQDGTRRDAQFREQQHAAYVHELTQRRIPFVEVSGSVGSRVEQVAALLAVRQRSLLGKS